MDPTEPAPLQSALSLQITLLDQHKLQLHTLTDSHQAMLGQLGLLTQKLNSILPKPVQTPPGPQPSQPVLVVKSTSSPGPLWGEACIPAANPYAGDLGRCRSFFIQCSLMFAHRPNTYATDKARVAYIVELSEEMS